MAQRAVEIDHTTDLMLQAQDGNNNALGELYDKLFPALFRYGASHNLSRENAEDFAGDVLEKVIRKKDRFSLQVSGPSAVPVSAWAYRIAKNHLVDTIRKSTVQTMSLDNIFEPGYTNESEHETLFNREILGPALDRLTPDQREVVRLRFISELNTPETAAAVGKSEDAVKKLQARGLVNLRKELGINEIPDVRKSLPKQKIEKKPPPAPKLKIVDHPEVIEDSPNLPNFKKNKDLIKKASAHPMWAEIPPVIKTALNLSFLNVPDDHEPTREDMTKQQRLIARVIGLTDTEIRFAVKHYLDRFQILFTK